MAVVKQNPDWVAALDTAEMAINNANIPNTKFSPYLLNIGYHHCLLPDTHWDAKRGDIKGKTAEEIVHNMQTTRETCQIFLQEVKNHDTDYANRHRQHTQYEVCDIVMVRMFPVNRDQLNP